MKTQPFVRWLNLLGFLCLAGLMLVPGSGSLVRAYLDQKGVAYEPFWINNIIAVKN